MSTQSQALRFARFNKDYEEDVEETDWPTIAFEEDPALEIAKKRKRKKGK